MYEGFYTDLNGMADTTFPSLLQSGFGKDMKII